MSYGRILGRLLIYDSCEHQKINKLAESHFTLPDEDDDSMENKTFFKYKENDYELRNHL
jgi:hypothetical protein